MELQDIKNKKYRIFWWGGTAFIGGYLAHKMITGEQLFDIAVLGIVFFVYAYYAVINPSRDPAGERLAVEKEDGTSRVLTETVKNRLSVVVWATVTVLMGVLFVYRLWEGAALFVTASTGFAFVIFAITLYFHFQEPTRETILELKREQ